MIKTVGDLLLVIRKLPTGLPICIPIDDELCPIMVLKDDTRVYIAARRQVDDEVVNQSDKKPEVGADVLGQLTGKLVE